MHRRARASSLTFSISKTVRRSIPRVPFRAVKEHVLGAQTSVSLVFVGDVRSRTLNRRYRGKDKPANVLAFPLSGTEGEIFLNLAEAARNAPRFHASFTAFTARLFIHALLHLKGYSHGGTMDRMEQATMRAFDL